jgi:hypothetical protein
MYKAGDVVVNRRGDVVTLIALKGITNEHGQPYYEYEINNSHGRIWVWVGARGYYETAGEKSEYDIVGYAKMTPNNVGIKYDSEKPRPYTLLQSLAKSLNGIIKVLEYGAKKYDVDNWKRVEPLEQKYMDALTRHYLAILNGEELDAESGLPHIDHLICNAMFVSQRKKEKDTINAQPPE